ncbi:uncharacterized protein BJ171DRAFT_513094 [Polychytrium aggregatum]|uniref:uncharacterized protein n=1 Tax=Polychytrium aggregatum TaxID=110093 RepID=UPI0022FE2242|nr:uncharacterized protein BJ171DRAFT_513094 [Polychytrium aggregatum]KAI9202738.1 hypothetical protein BJ171DRAFT_513094 [Polychytrium aggregatum]
MQSIDISPTPSPRRERSRPTSSQGRSFGSSQSSGTLTLAQRLTNFGLPRAVLIGIQRGDVDAHLTAARMVSDGKPANNPAWTTAAELFQAAADKGDLEAAFQLGWLHFAGIGIAQSDIEAIAYWHLVHSQSSNAIMKSIAMFMTGCCCYLGRGTQLDESRAHQFFCESMTPEFPFGRLLVYGDGKTESFSPVAVGFFQLCQLGSDHDWFCRHLVAKCMLGGFGVKKDREFAVGIMHELAYQGYSISQFALAECYCMGLGVPEDPVKGIKWLTTAANQGNADAQFALGGCYCKGEDVTQDHAKGIEWFTKAANQGNADAEFALGVCYCKGEGVTQDYAKAIKWLTKAARQGNAESQDWLGDCYRDGKGVPKNTETARSWYQKAAAQGNKNAQTSLSKLR